MGPNSTEFLLDDKFKTQTIDKRYLASEGKGPDFEKISTSITSKKPDIEKTKPTLAGKVKLVSFKDVKLDVPPTKPILLPNVKDQGQMNAVGEESFFGPEAVASDYVDQEISQNAESGKIENLMVAEICSSNDSITQISARKDKANVEKVVAQTKLVSKQKHPN